MGSPRKEGRSRTFRFRHISHGRRPFSASPSSSGVRLFLFPVLVPVSVILATSLSASFSAVTRALVFSACEAVCAIVGWFPSASPSIGLLIVAPFIPATGLLVPRDSLDPACAMVVVTIPSSLKIPRFRSFFPIRFRRFDGTTLYASFCPSVLLCLTKAEETVSGLEGKG
jgi:hypothetical protein